MKNYVQWLLYALGSLSAVMYAELKHNTEGYYWLIPYMVLMLCLVPRNKK